MSKTPFNPQQTLNSAMQLMQASRFKEALQLFAQLERFGMQDFRLDRTMGAAYERLGDAENTVKYFNKSIAKMPHQADLHYAIGNMQSKVMQHDLALASYQKAVDLHSNNAQYQLKLAESYRINKEHTKALKLYNSLQSTQANNVSLISGLCRVYSETGDLHKAVEVLSTGIKRNPNKESLIHQLGWLYKEMGRADEAVERFTQCLSINKNNPEYIEDLALALLDAGKAQEAIEHLNNGIKLHPHHPKLNRLLANINFEFDNSNHLQHYQTIPIDNMPIDLFQDYVQQLIQIGDIKQAQELVTKVKKQNINANSHLALQIKLLEKQHKFEQIISILRKKVKQSNDAFFIETLCKAYLAIGEGNLAIQTIKPQLERFNNDQFYWALYTTGLRMIGSDLYHRYCDYDKYVFNRPLLLQESQGSLAEFNAELRSALEQLHITKRNPLDQSLVGGTQTVGMLLNRPIPIVMEFKQALVRTFKQALSSINYDPKHPVASRIKDDVDFSSSWSVRLQDQGFHISHVHPKGWYSCAYYVNVPSEVNDESKQGWLNMGKPGLILKDPMQAEHWVKPKEGELVLFPSYFWHGTEAFNSNACRMSVGLDILPK